MCSSSNVDSCETLRIKIKRVSFLCFGFSQTVFFSLSQLSQNESYWQMSSILSQSLLQFDSKHGGRLWMTSRTPLMSGIYICTSTCWHKIQYILVPKNVTSFMDQPLMRKSECPAGGPPPLNGKCICTFLFPYWNRELLNLQSLKNR